MSAAVVVAGGRVLLIRRRVSEGHLSWQFPAGGIEPGESPEAAAVRETYEETGLTVIPVGPLGQRVHPYTGRHLFYVACETAAVPGTEPIPVANTREACAIVWSTHADLPVYVPHGFFAPVQAYVDGRSRG